MPFWCVLARVMRVSRWHTYAGVQGHRGRLFLVCEDCGAESEGVDVTSAPAVTTTAGA